MKKAIVGVLLAMGLGVTAWAEEEASHHYVWIESTDHWEDSPSSSIGELSEFVVKPVS